MTKQLTRITDYLAHHAAATPDAEFLVLGEQRLNYREAAEWVDACSAALLAAGIGRGDCVATYGPPRPEYFLTFLATAGIGAMWLGLSPKLTTDELQHNVSDASPRLAFGIAEGPAQDEQLGALANATPSLQRVVTRVPSPLGVTIDEFLGEGVRLADSGALARARAAVDPADPAAVVYTSGSTGRPKGALLPHRGLVICSEVQNEHWVDFEPLRTVCDLPIDHVGCLGDLCCSTFVAGGAIVFMEKFDSRGVLRLIEEERISFWGAIPTMFLLATRTEEWKTADLSSLRRIIWSGAAAPAALVAELRELGVPLSTSYGMTETVGSVTYTADDDSDEVLTATIGKPDPRYEVRVARPDGSTCDTGEEGELLVRGDFIMSGYLNRPEATAETIRDGWLHTGDAAVANDSGNLRLVGRLSDMYKSGGYNVYCREVESVLESHPAVALAAVVGVPDPLYGEVGHAFLIPEDGAEIDDESLKEHALQQLANYKIPKRFISEPELPRLAIGKVDKRELRRRAQPSSADEPTP